MPALLILLPVLLHLVPWALGAAIVAGLLLRRRRRARPRGTYPPHTRNASRLRHF